MQQLFRASSFVLSLVQELSALLKVDARQVSSLGRTPHWLQSHRWGRPSRLQLSWVVAMGEQNAAPALALRWTRVCSF